MRVEKGDMEVGSRRAWLQYGKFIAAADSNIEFITAGGRQIDLIGPRIGESAAEGPSAQRRGGYKRDAAPGSLPRVRWQASMIVSARALTSLGAECHSPRTQMASACVISQRLKRARHPPDNPPLCGGHLIGWIPILMCLFCNIPTIFSVLPRR